MLPICYFSPPSLFFLPAVVTDDLSRHSSCDRELGGTALFCSVENCARSNPNCCPFPCPSPVSHVFDSLYLFFFLSRVSLDFPWQNWPLVIRGVTLSDGGVYRCHSSAHPPAHVAQELRVVGEKEENIIQDVVRWIAVESRSWPAGKMSLERSLSLHQCTYQILLYCSISTEDRRSHIETSLYRSAFWSRVLCALPALCGATFFLYHYDDWVTNARNNST